MSCRLCGSRQARYVCFNCGAEVCEECFDPDEWICTKCGGLRSVPVHPELATSAFIASPLALLGITLIILGVFLVVLSGFASEGESFFTFFFFPIPVIVGGKADPLLLAALAVLIIAAPILYLYFMFTRVARLSQPLRG